MEQLYSNFNVINGKIHVFGSCMRLFDKTLATMSLASFLAKITLA